jgi:hypothetical protein
MTELVGGDLIFRILRLSLSQFVETQIVLLFRYGLQINLEIGPKRFVDGKLVQEGTNVKQTLHFIVGTQFRG